MYGPPHPDLTWGVPPKLISVTKLRDKHPKIQAEYKLHLN